MRLRKQSLAFCMLVASVGAHAFNTVTLVQPWVRTPAGAQKMTAAYMELESGDTVAIIKIESPLAGRVEIHSTTNDKGVMKMRKVNELTLPAGKTVKLTPGGMHLMLLDLKKPIKDGDTIPFALTFRGLDKHVSGIRFEAVVRKSAPPKAR